MFSCCKFYTLFGGKSALFPGCSKKMWFIHLLGKSELLPVKWIFFWNSLLILPQTPGWEGIRARPLTPTSTLPIWRRSSCRRGQCPPPSTSGLSSCCHTRVRWPADPSSPCPASSAALSSLRLLWISTSVRPRSQIRTCQSCKWSLFCDLDHKFKITSSGILIFPVSSKRIGAKFTELSFNFPILVYWLCIGRPSCLAALGREFSNRNHFFWTTL